jgi:AcrR family transcriptional regulator
MTTTERAYGGVSAVERRDLRRRRLLAAGAEIVRDQGLHAVSYRGVCRTAGLTERYFYESFANVDELLVALFEQELNAAMLEVMASVQAAGAAPEDAAAAAVGCFVDRIADDRLLSRLLVESPAHQALRAPRRAAIDAFVDQMVKTGFSLVRGPASPAEARRARNVALILGGGFNELLTEWVESEFAATKAEIVADTVELFFAAIAHFGRPVGPT